jgi:aminopeptidase
MLPNPRLDRLADVLVRYSVAVGPADVVSLNGPSLAEPLLLALYRTVLEVGGHPLLVMAPAQCAELLFEHGADEQLAFRNPLEMREVEAVDVAIHVLATHDVRAFSRIDPARQAMRRKARQPLMDKFLERANRKELRWSATPYPCASAAREAEMTLSAYDDFLFAAGLLDREDPADAWRAQGQRQERLIDFLRNIHELRFVKPGATDVRINVAGRKWINGDGHVNFPDGEVFTAPWEDETEGVVTFDCPTVHCGRDVQGARLVFRAGRVVEATAAVGEDYLVRVLEQEPGTRILGEVALGCNYAIGQATRNALLDEKIGGTFHLALGAAYPETGGRNHSGLHWDLVSDLRGGGHVEADGILISRDGRFVNPRWPQPDP